MKICVRAHDLKVKGENQIVKMLKDYDADGMQLVCYKSFEDIDKQTGSITPMRAKAIGDTFKMASLDTTLIGAYFNPVHSNRFEVERGIKVFKEYLSVAKLLGGCVVASETGSYNDEPWVYHSKNRTEIGLNVIINTFRDLCDYAEKQNAMVGMEGASGHVVYDIDTMCRVVEKIERDNLKVVFDLYNFLDETNYRDYLNIMQYGIDKLDDKIYCFHMKDCIIDDEGYKQCAVGAGNMNFEKILSMIKNYNSDAVLILEGTVGRDIARSVEYLRNIWRRI